MTVVKYFYRNSASGNLSKSPNVILLDSDPQAPATIRPLDGLVFHHNCVHLQVELMGDPKGAASFLAGSTVAFCENVRNIEHLQ